MRRKTAGALGLVWAVVSTTAHAEQRSATLDYRVEPALRECPDEQAMRDLIAGRLGYDPFAEGSPRRLELRIRKAGADLEGTITMTDESGRKGRERKYTESADHCAELGSTLALSGSILIDPSALKGPKPASSKVEEPPSGIPPELATSVDASPAPVAPPSRSPLRGRLGANVVGNVGAEPAPTVGGMISGGLGAERWSMDLEGRMDVPASVHRSGAEVRASLLVGNLVPCARFAPMFACGVASVGVLQGSVGQSGLTQSHDSVYVAAGVRIGAEVPVSTSFALTASVGALAPLTRTVLDAQVGASKTTLWETPALSAVLALGAVYAWP